MVDTARAGRATTLLVTFAAAIVVVAGLKSAGDLVGSIALALVLTVVVQPLRRLLERRLPPWLASCLALVTVYAGLASMLLAIVLAIGRLVVLLGDYRADVDDVVRSALRWLADLGVGQAQVESIARDLDVGKVVDGATSVLSDAAGSLSDLGLVLVLLLFSVFDAAYLPGLLDRARTGHADIVDALGGFATSTRGYLAAAAGFGLVIAVLDGISLWAMDVPGAFVWAVLAFVTNFVPNVGFVIGVIPPVIMAALEHGWGTAVTVVVVYGVINFLVQSVVQPRFVGNVVGLSPTLTFFSVVFWAFVLGPSGALLAVPMSLLVKAVLLDADPSLHWVLPFVRGRP